VEVKVENESGVQTPRLETWKVVDNDLLKLNKGENREVTYKKITCK